MWPQSDIFVFLIVSSPHKGQLNGTDLKVLAWYWGTKNWQKSVSWQNWCLGLTACLLCLLLCIQLWAIPCAFLSPFSAGSNTFSPDQDKKVVVRLEVEFTSFKDQRAKSYFKLILLTTLTRAKASLLKMRIKFCSQLESELLNVSCIS